MDVFERIKGSRSEEQPVKPQLRVNRAEAKQQISKRLEEGDVLRKLVDGTQGSRDVAGLESEFDSWDAYNYDFLENLFTTDKYAKEYRNSGARFAIIPDSTWLDDAQQIRETLGVKMTKLVSIRERLELVQEQSPGQDRLELANKRPAGTAEQVFIVHGHDDGAKEAVARFVTKLGFDPVILHERPNEGRTLIEKFEGHSDVAFALVLFTPDDTAHSKKDGREEARARQNVVFELGFFIAKLGRERVAVLLWEGVAKPSDYDGVVYTPFDQHGAWKYKLAGEFKAAGLSVDMNRIA
jgi:predicted nucleotide-binding protein